MLESLRFDDASKYSLAAVKTSSTALLYDTCKPIELWPDFRFLRNIEFKLTNKQCWYNRCDDRMFSWPIQELFRL